MTQKDYLKQLRDELHGHPLRERFLEELQNHSEDLEVEKLSEEKWEKRMGQPKEIRDHFIYAMNPIYKFQVITLYIFSLIILYILWSFILNEVLVPWDVSPLQERAPEGTWPRTLNDYFEGPQGSLLISIFSGTLVFISFLVSFLNSYENSTPVRIGKFGYSGLLNYFYIGLFILVLAGVIFLKGTILNFELPYLIPLFFWLALMTTLPIFQYRSLKKYQN